MVHLHVALLKINAILQMMTVHHTLGDEVMSTMTDMKYQFPEYF